MDEGSFDGEARRCGTYSTYGTRSSSRSVRPMSCVFGRASLFFTKKQRLWPERIGLMTLVTYIVITHTVPSGMQMVLRATPS